LFGLLSLELKAIKPSEQLLIRMALERYAAQMVLVEHKVVSGEEFLGQFPLWASLRVSVWMWVCLRAAKSNRAGSEMEAGREGMNINTNGKQGEMSEPQEVGTPGALGG